MIGAVRTQAGRAAMAIVGRHTATRDRLMHAAARRGRCLVLCYHRIAPAAGIAEAVDPVPPERFADQMRALKAAGDVLRLDEVLAFPPTRERPAFAVTFDDDDPAHVRYALPILHALGIPATFFLSGRSLRGLGPYWWTLVERSVAEIGVAATGRVLGQQGRTLKEIVRACRNSGITPLVPVRESPPVMTPGDIRTLADAGMTIGFHTVGHPALTALSRAGVDRALTEGRGALSDAAGVPVELLAYPYGKADVLVADAARRAGFRAAFVTGERAVGCESNPFLVPRWQPGPVAGRVLLAQAALRLVAPRLER